MILRTLFREWWTILLQGIFLIALSIIIFNNPGAVLTAVAVWLGVVVILSGVTGLIAWFVAPKEHRELMSLVGSIAFILIGILMIMRTLITIKAITIAFGLIVLMIGLALASSGWNARKHWSAWWLILLLGIASIVMGVKSIFDIVSGIETISGFIGTSVLISGIGLIVLAFLKKKLVHSIKNKVNEIRSYES